MRKQDQFDGAIKAIEQAVQNEPRNYNHLTEYAGILKLQGKTDEAIDQFKKAWQNIPK